MSRTADRLPVTAWVGLTRRSQEGEIERWARLASDGAAAALAEDDERTALTMLEQGRVLLASARLDRGASLDDLAAVAPALADRLRVIRSELDANPSDVDW